MFDHEPMPRDLAIDELCDVVNGVGMLDPIRRGFMSRERANRTLDLFKSALRRMIPSTEAPEEMMRKTVSVATGLAYYNLRAPALNLFPIVTPLRNSLRRVQPQFPGNAYIYERVTAVAGSGIPVMGWVPEGQRTASVSYTTSRTTLNYATLGEEDSVTRQAELAAEGFEDEAALVQLRAMLRLFYKQEMAGIGGNASLALGTPTAPTLSASGTGGTLPTATYSVIAVALTAEGYQQASVANGVTQTLTITGNDGSTYTLNGGSSNKSANATQAVTSGQNLFASTPVIAGAGAYAWYVGAAGAESLQTITTINSATFSAPLSSTNQSASVVTADCSTNSTYAYDGLLTWGLKGGNGAYSKSLATGTAGTGTILTVSPYGGSNEVDLMFKSIWDNYNVSPTVLYANSAGVRAIATFTLDTNNMALLAYNGNSMEGGVPEFKLTSRGVVAWYFNPYAPDGGMKVTVRAHPLVPPGTFLAWTEQMPPWYRSNALPDSGQIVTRADTYAEVWPRISHTQYYGIYSQEVLAVYAPFGIGILNNVAGA